MKILILLLFLLVAGCADKRAGEVFYVYEQMTGHCFKVTKTSKGLDSDWIACHAIPKGAKQMSVQEWEPEEWE